MIEQEHLFLFLEIIAICMIIITVVTVFVAIQYAKTMYKVDTFIAVGQEGVSTLSRNLSVMTQKSGEVFTVFNQFFKKNPKTKGDTMNKDNLVSFAFGAVVTGIGAYYAFKNKDEITNKINDIEETIEDNYEVLVSQSKEKLEMLTKSVQLTAQEFLHGGTADGIKENEIKQLVKKLDKLQKEIESFKVKS